LASGHGGKTSFPLIFCSGVLTTVNFSRDFSIRSIIEPLALFLVAAPAGLLATEVSIRVSGREDLPNTTTEIVTLKEEML